jgi:hypothetical protein
MYDRRCGPPAAVDREMQVTPPSAGYLKVIPRRGTIFGNNSPPHFDGSVKFQAGASSDAERPTAWLGM